MPFWTAKRDEESLLSPRGARRRKRYTSARGLETRNEGEEKKEEADTWSASLVDIEYIDGAFRG